MAQSQEVEIEVNEDGPSENLNLETFPSPEQTELNMISRTTTTSELRLDGSFPDLGDSQDGISVISYRPRSDTGSTVAGVFDRTGSRNDIMSDIDEDERETSLMLVKHQKIDMKNFATEVRALKDIDRFLENPTVLLNVHKTKLEDIVDVMVEKIIKDKDLQGVNFSSARTAFFTKDSVHCLSHIIQGTEISEGGGWEETQNWLVTMADLPNIQQSHIAIARLRHATNLGRTLQGTHLVVLILSPIKTKRTKNSLELGRTFATMLSDIDFRQLLLEAETKEECMALLASRKDSLSNNHNKIKTTEPTRVVRSASRVVSSFALKDKKKEDKDSLSPGKGIYQDFKRRWPHYLSDFTDGVTGHRTLFKLASTVMFLYFACILPSIAFGVLNNKNTKGKIDVQKVLISQIIGGTMFSLLGGQPLIILLTTAPLALYIKVIYTICEDFGLDFMAMYTCTGLWNAFFLIMYSVFGVSNLMRWSTRSTEEIFALFISVAFTVDAASSIKHELSSPYCIGVPYSSCNICNVPGNLTTSACTVFGSQTCYCSREAGTLYLLLSLGTVLVGVTLYNFKKSPFLDANKREALADYALPVAVLFFSFIGSYFFSGQSLRKFQASGDLSIEPSSMSSLSTGAIFGACGLGFCLSLLFFMDQNISSAMVNNPGNRLKKGSAFHLDLLVVAVINGILSAFGLPWVHGALPHSPLHVRALADVEERVDQGHVFDIIVKVRETRLSTLIAHIFIGLSLFMLPSPLDYIPTAVLDGLFLFVAATSLYDNQMFERLLLIVTEQSAYPPNHYIRRVPQRKMHTYTAMQILQLAILCAFGFSPISYLKMVFPILLLLLLPVRHLLVPRLIERKFLDALDTYL